MPECTVWKNIYDSNRNCPKDVAIRYFGRKITYGELFDRVALVKKAFLTAGVRRGDNVAFLTLSCPEMIYAILALNQIGAVANMVNPTFSAEQMRDRINDSEAKLILVLDQLYERLKPVADEICPALRIIIPMENAMPAATRLLAHGKLKKKIPYSSATVTWNRFLTNADPDTPDVEEGYTQNTAALMVYSSGTTGASKGIVLTNDGINSTIRHYSGGDFRLTRGDKLLHLGAPWLSTVMVVCCLAPLKLGVTIVIEPIFTAEAFTKAVLKYRTEMVMSTISHWLAFFRDPRIRKTDLSFIKYAITGGEKVLPETEKEINALLHAHGCKVNLLIGYGMCELGSTAVTNSHEHFRFGSAGFPITDAVVAAFDPDTDMELMYNRRGEIRVCSPSCMKEYYKRPDATAEFFKKDSSGNIWGCTGDVGYVDEDGFVYVQGRMHDTFCGKDRQKHYCFDVEDILLTSPHISQCEVVGTPMPDGTDRLCAFAVRRADCKLPDREIIDDLFSICSSGLPETMQPEKICLLPAFPVKPSGKRDMEALKKLASEER